MQRRFGISTNEIVTDVTMLQNVCTSLWVCDGGTVTHFDGTVNDYKKKIAAQANEAGVVQHH